MKTFHGKHGIKVTILADSINAAGNRFLTFEIEYWRGILAELNTHRALSRNSFSSRAVPFDKMLEQLTGRPVRFGANQAGMQDKGEDYDKLVEGRVVDLGPEWEHGNPVEAWEPYEAWDEARKDAIFWANAFKEAGYHKQIYNRLLEPFQMMKTVLSGTELSNFFWLRDDDAADPSLHELARVMREAAAESVPTLLQPGEWHLPYINVEYYDGGQHFYVEEHYVLVGGNKVYPHLTLEQAIKISCARCAAVSYRNEGYGLEKSIEVFDRLVGSERKHASAFEHCATPMNTPPEELTEHGLLIAGSKGINMPFWPETWADGVTHVDREGNLWSGNIKGFIQYRKLIKGENYNG